MTRAISTPSSAGPSAPSRAPAAVGRRTLLVIAAALVAVAALLARGVIPTVSTVWVRTVTGGEGSEPALWAVVVAHLIVAAVLLWAAVRGATRHRAVRRVLAVLGAGALVQALMLLDAAAAFHTGGPPMQAATRRVIIAAGGDAAAGLWLLATTVRAPRAFLARLVAAVRRDLQ